MDNVLKEASDRDGYTIPEFCRRFGISTPTYYKMRAAGEGPREMRKVGSVVRISAGAIADWVREGEASADAEAHRAKLKQRSQFATSGGAR
ncbi:helix-turn-helix domain-containing protein [Mesorhizobium sp. LSJC264A00]|uniref:helix-turn-helix transcriptional regulator n=1 Tax=unclassified Mesorhizobium TaxID=325217 RepID=UPI0003CF1960|nr:helix-turn-helix domain-containing protein [Mesorhizobium sp. LSJC264A00]ESX23027.1 hypothetical protein X767_16745 [Mesorhizobium sp. LSJC264A00]